MPYNDTLAATRLEALNYLINTPDDLSNGQNRVRHAANLPIWASQLAEVRAVRAANSASGSRGGVQYDTSGYRGRKGAGSHVQPVFIKNIERRLWWRCGAWGRARLLSAACGGVGVGGASG